MNYPSIEIQGNILSSEILGLIRADQIKFQQGKDFGLPNDSKLKEEISMAWQDAKSFWAIYKSKLSRLKPDETGTTETRNFWIVPVLTSLGYNLQVERKGEELNGKLFLISHRDINRDAFPVYIGGYNESLDRKPENKALRVSPHALMQEYLNFSEHLYGIVTNGRQLRLLRDASRISRLSYVEFNLERMMEDDLYGDFIILFRLLHASRIPTKIDGGPESIMEFYHQEGLASGQRIREKLSTAVEDTIITFANGFLNHPLNTDLRKANAEGHIKSESFYHHQLRLIYRLLFLFKIEERNLVYSENATPATKKQSAVYYNHYSLMRLRKLAAKLPPPDANRNHDLWLSLLSTFALFETQPVGEKLGIMALSGDIFSYEGITNDQYDMHLLHLDNISLLKVIKSLCWFENNNHVLVAVNYRDLDVEEFGSVYEGLLEYDAVIEAVPGTDNYHFSFKKGTGRSSSGSHYTPEELVQPLIKHSLDYLLDDREKLIRQEIEQKRLKGDPQRKAREQVVSKHLLDLKIADVACGSGHILLSAARRIADRYAAIVEENDQPTPSGMRHATRLVIKSCIYGVDKNPLAVELCKVALWLESHNPGEPLGFLDHHIKCGDAIVGLAHREELENGIPDEAFKTLPGDDKDISNAFRRQNTNERKQREAEALQLQADFEKTAENSVQEAMEEYGHFVKMPENTPTEILAKQHAYRKFYEGKGHAWLKRMADLQVAQFFIPKSEEHKNQIVTDAEYRQVLAGHKSWQGPKTAISDVIAENNRFFHWFIEFPEVFHQSGFDCILGNPPFLGGGKISTNYGKDYLNYLQSYFSPIGGQCDLVGYFFRRNFKIINQLGFVSLISTNTISQGDTREGSLDQIVNRKGQINFALKSTEWPGRAAVYVTLISFNKRDVSKKYLDGKEVIHINSFLEGNLQEVFPSILFENSLKGFLGSGPVGDGFLIDQELAENLLRYEENKLVVRPYLMGDDINSDVSQHPSRHAIYFYNWEIEKAKHFAKCFEIIEKKVKPEREKNNDKRRREIWWQFSRPTIELYNTVKNLKSVICLARVSKNHSPILISREMIFSDSTVVFAFEGYRYFSLIQSNIHESWARKYSSTLETRFRYTPEDCFETFPFPQNLSLRLDKILNDLGEIYHEFRRKYMLSIHLGLTKVYNAFNTLDIHLKIKAEALQGLNKQAVEKHYGKEVWNLWNHLQKTPGTCSIEEAIAGIVKLRELHIEMDNAVLEAYGWQDVQLRHDFYEVDYLPENDRVRFTIHPDARKEILKRLLELNHKIFEQEAREGLHKEDEVTKFYQQKGTPIPPEVSQWFKKGKEYKTNKPKTSIAKEKEMGYGDLFKQ